MKPSQDQLEYGTTALLIALAARNLETGAHTKRVAGLALQLGRTVGLTGDELNFLKFGALLHDLGKLRTPDSVLCKPAGLSPSEWTIMRKHPVTGAHMLRALGYDETICLIVEQHHERWDGSGYPYGLKAHQITIGARIFSIVDTFDAITADRCYRAGQSPETALHEITSWSARQFDPELVAAFVNLHRPDHTKRALPDERAEASDQTSAR